MAVSDETTLLSIDRWSEIMGLNPCAFNQGFDPADPAISSCNEVWCQEAWMGIPGRLLARDDVAFAIRIAEDQIHDTLSFWPAPVWITGEEHAWPRPRRGAQWAYPPVALDHGYFIEGGRRETDEIDAANVVGYAAGVATVTVLAADILAAGASINEIEVFFADETDPRWRIRNLTRNLDAATGNVVLTGNLCYFINPDLWYANCDPIDITIAVGNLVVNVDVLRVFNDPEQQAQIVFKGGTNACAGTAPCSETCQTACITSADDRNSIVRTPPASFSAGAFTSASLVQNRIPDAMRVWYRAGLDLQTNGRMRSSIEQAIVSLANTYLPEAPCDCNQLRRRWDRDRERQDINSIDVALAMSAFGTTDYGAVFAWSVVKRLSPLAGASAT